MDVDYASIIRDTRKLLQEKSEWRERFAGYAEEIAANEGSIRKIRDLFHEWSPLMLYLNTTNAKNAKTAVKFDMRYLGQSVATLSCSPEKITISTKDRDDKNRRYFDCEIQLSDDLWNSDNASKFRAFFRGKPQTANPGNEEHRLESLLITEFSKKSEEKALPYIQPVRIAKLRFPMPTPLTASKKGKPVYAKNGVGGNIDILTRVGRGRGTHLCIMELKDEAEPPAGVLAQGLKYAVFIRELLRSEAGLKWYNLMGFGADSVPPKLTLYTACVMPYAEGADRSFGEYEIEEDTIQLHYVYFKEAGNQIEEIKTSLGRKNAREESAPTG